MCSCGEVVHPKVTRWKGANDGRIDVGARTSFTGSVSTELKRPVALNCSDTVHETMPRQIAESTSS